MADEIDEYVEFELDVNDQASPKLSRLEKNIGKLGAKVNEASANFVGMIKQSAMMASFFALGPAIAGAKEYIDHVDKMAKLSGLAAERAAGISNALQGAGVDAGEVEVIFDKLSKTSTRMGEGQKSLMKLAKSYGVELKGGPEKSLLAMSKAVESGKLGTQGIARVLNVTTEQAAKLRDALEAGPEETKKRFDELAEKNKAFTDEGVAGVAAWHDASHRVGIAWNRLTAGIIVKLAPALEKLSTKFEGAIDGWVSGAEKFGDFMVKHMDKLIAGAKLYAKIMLVNVAAQKLTGKGIVDIGGAGIGAGKKFLAKRAEKAAAAGTASVGLVASLKGIAKGGPLAMLKQLIPKLPLFKPFFSGMMGLLKLAPIGGIIMLVVGAVKALGENFNGITTRLKSTFGGIFRTVSRIGSKIADLFSADSGLGKFVGAVGYAFLEVVNKIGEAMGFILNMVEKIVDAIPDIFKPIGDVTARWKEAQEYQQKVAAQLKKGGLKAEDAAYKQAMARAKRSADVFMKTGSWVDRYAQAQAPEAPKKKTPTGAPEAQVYQDFRNSRFDIKQAFAEGYDPDRIAVAFSNDVAALGERKLQSGFAPMFTVR